MKLLALLLTIAVALAPVQSLARGHASSHSSSSHSYHSSGGHSSSRSSSGKSEHVGGYTRRDGTHAQSYKRDPAGTFGHSTRSKPTRRSASPTAHHASPSAAGGRDSHGRIKRSAAAKDAFKRSHPCPSTGKSTGACPGYVVDHVRALKHGGADDPSNMQWQTTAEAKAKDKWE